MKLDLKSMLSGAVLAVTTLFALVGCDDSRTEPADPLVGSWVLTNVTHYDSSGTSYEPGWDPYRDSTGQVTNLVYTFNSDGTGTMASSSTSDFTYSTTADEITFIFTDGGYDLPYALTGDTLIFTITTMDEYAQISGQIVLSFTKQ